MLSSSITSVSGSSKVFSIGLVTYSDKSKSKILNISKKIIKNNGAVSEQVCRAMVKNVSKISKTNMSISVTGIAGPNGGTRKKPVGLVYIGIKKGKKIQINNYLFKNKKRTSFQKTAVNKSLNLILGLLK